MGSVGPLRTYGAAGRRAPPRTRQAQAGVAWQRTCISYSRLTARANANRSSTPPRRCAAAAASAAEAATGATPPSAIRSRRSLLPSTALSNCAMVGHTAWQGQQSRGEQQGAGVWLAFQLTSCRPLSSLGCPKLSACMPSTGCSAPPWLPVCAPRQPAHLLAAQGQPHSHGRIACTRLLQAPPPRYPSVSCFFFRFFPPAALRGR